MYVKNKPSAIGSVKEGKEVLGSLSHLQTAHTKTTTHAMCLMRKDTAFVCPRGIDLWFQVFTGVLERVPSTQWD